MPAMCRTPQRQGREVQSSLVLHFALGNVPDLGDESTSEHDEVIFAPGLAVMCAAKLHQALSSFQQGCVQTTWQSDIA